MSLLSLFPLLALVCVTGVASTAPQIDKSFANVIKNSLNQEVTIIHFIGVESKAKVDVVAAVIGLGPANTPQEKIYDCKFVISKSSNGSEKNLEKFNCEAFEVPYEAVDPVPFRPVAGGWSPITISDNNVQGLFYHVNKALGQRNPPLQILNINNAESQIVAGINYRLTVQAGPNGANSHVTHICQVVILVQKWLNLTEVTNVKCDPMAPAPYTGGWQKVDVNEASVLNAAKFALSTLNSQCNCLFRKSFTEIISASKQLVNGFKYKIVWKIGESTCRNNEENNNKDLTECPLTSANSVSTCEVTVWERFNAIEPHYTLVSHNC